MLERSSSRIGSKSVLLLGLLLTACSTSDGTTDAHSESPITRLTADTVKDQCDIAACGTFSSATLLDMMNRNVTAGPRLSNVSESFLTLVMWLDQLLDDYADAITTLEEGVRNWGHVAELLSVYGVANHDAFLPGDVRGEAAIIQSAAARMRTELATGALSAPGARQDIHIVLAALAGAFGLRPEVAAELRRVYAPHGYFSPIDYAPPSDLVLAPSAVRVMVADLSTHGLVEVPLAQVLGRKARMYDPSVRTGGPHVLTRITPRSQGDLRAVKAALVDGQPLLMSFWVDFTAREGATFRRKPRAGALPEDNLHSVVAYDFQATTSCSQSDEQRHLVGVPAPASAFASIVDEGEVELFRVGNSWGTAFVSPNVPPGSLDIHTEYLFTSGTTDRPRNIFYLDDFVVPVAYAEHFLDNHGAY